MPDAGAGHRSRQRRARPRPERSRAHRLFDAGGHRPRPPVPQPALGVIDGAVPIALCQGDHRRLRLERPALSNPEMAGSQQGTALSSWAEGASQAVNPERLRGAVRESGRCGALHSSSDGWSAGGPEPLLGPPVGLLAHCVTLIPPGHRRGWCAIRLHSWSLEPRLAPGRPMSFPR